MNEERENVNQVKESQQAEENVTTPADEKKKVELFEEVSFDNAEEAKLEMSKENVNVIVGLITLILTLPWTIVIIKNGGKVPGGTLITIFGAMMLVGVIAACVKIHLIRYVIKTMGIMAKIGYWLPFGGILCIAFCISGGFLGLIGLFYIPGAYVFIALIGAWKEREEAKEYLEYAGCQGHRL